MQLLDGCHEWCKAEFENGEGALKRFTRDFNYVIALPRLFSKHSLPVEAGDFKVYPLRLPLKLTATTAGNNSIKERILECDESRHPSYCTHSALRFSSVRKEDSLNVFLRFEIISE